MKVPEAFCEGFAGVHTGLKDRIIRVQGVRVRIRVPLTLGIKIAQMPYIVWSLGPKALTYESLDS